MKKILYLILLIITAYIVSANRDNTVTNKFQDETISSIKNITDIDNFVKEVNEYRKSIDDNLPQVSYNEKLEKASFIQALYNYENEKRGHIHPKFENVLYKVKSTGYKSEVKWFHCAENITRSLNYTDDIELIEENIIDAYIASESHRKALLDKDFTKIGTYTILINNKLYNCLILSE